MSFHRYEFMMIGAATSIIAIETALSDRYGRGRLVDHLKKARDDGMLTDKQYDLLDGFGLPIRNSYAHGDLTHAALTPPLAIVASTESSSTRRSAWVRLGVDVAADGGHEFTVYRPVADAVKFRHASAGTANDNQVTVAEVVLEKTYAAQLSTPKLLSRTNGYAQAESKKVMKARGMKLLDRAEAILLAVYEPEPLHKPHRRGLLH
ncbi:hypothetical protein [Streptomyces sp. SAI-129]|uniref:hypothetical protein n=1 Tax=Streptomyces sp. SAI-129 TaxID=3377727 RepID=UPI003C7BB4F2